jgi:hypothetical protein
MRGWRTLFHPSHMQPRPGVVDLIPPQVNQFHSTKAMTECHQDHRGVPVAVSVCPGCTHRLLDLRRGQIFPRPQIGVLAPQRRNCSIYGGWGTSARFGFVKGNSPSSIRTVRLSDVIRTVCNRNLPPPHARLALRQSRAAGTVEPAGWSGPVSPADTRYNAVPANLGSGGIRSAFLWRGPT